MTFLEAAIEILRQQAGVMHFSEVARRAVDDNLLSHVGRDPEAAMRSCLNSAVRSGRNGEEPLIVRERPGYYGIRPGAELPEPPPRPEVRRKVSVGSADETNANSRTQNMKSGKVVRAGASARRRSDGIGPQGPHARRRPLRSTEETESKGTDDNAMDDAAEQIELIGDDEADHGGPTVEFEAPRGSGLEGVTDVALVMANAMSRLVEERPELKDELHAIQQHPSEPPPGTQSPSRTVATRGSGQAQSYGARSAQAASQAASSEDRGNRRRRRRRRRGKRVDWSAGTGARSDAGSATINDKLLDAVASILGESGPRSLHVRQIAETLASQGLLGGEISEIERAVTASILLDVRDHGRASRFVARGDARYQVQGTRVPEGAAAAEQTLRVAIDGVEEETDRQLIQWLQSLGARSLESLVRVYLQREGYPLLAALPPSRGIGKLVVEDPEGDDEGRNLALVIPRRTVAEARLWEGELERNACSSFLLFVMGEPPDDCGDARVIGPTELAAWLRAHQFGVQTVQFEVSLLDMTVIESIGGLDT